MNLGLAEIILILVIVGVVFVVTWIVSKRRFSKRSGNTGSTKES